MTDHSLNIHERFLIAARKAALVATFHIQLKKSQSKRFLSLHFFSDPDLAQ